MPAFVHRMTWARPRSRLVEVHTRTMFIFLGMENVKLFRLLGASAAGLAFSIAIPLVIPVVMKGQSVQGSVPSGTATSTPLALSFDDAIARGLKTNLGLLTSQQTSEEVRAQRLHALSALLPQVTGQVSMTDQQINLQALGFNVSLPPSAGFQIPRIVGPYSYQSALLNASIPLFDYRNISNFRASRESLKAAQLSVNNARDLVVQAVGNAYLQIIADAARVSFHASGDRCRQCRLHERGAPPRRWYGDRYRRASLASRTEAAPAATRRGEQSVRKG